MTRIVQWLHISDLHLKCEGRELWWQTENDFERSVRKVVREIGTPDFIFLTGDLTNSGAEDQFKLVDGFLDKLLSSIDESAPPEKNGIPILMAVPGNHDLVRPEGLAAFPYRVLDRYEKGADDSDVDQLSTSLWQGNIAEKRKAAKTFFDPLFGCYRQWFERRIMPQLEARAKQVNFSHFPCDFTAVFDIDGSPMAIVGLNSAWLQYTADNFERKLAIPLEQFHAALGTNDGKNPLQLFSRCKKALLLMHHPSSWLAPRARQVFNEDIFPPDRFSLCVFGHQHEGRAETVLQSGGRPRYYFQASSLFGVEHYGTSREQRTMGYAWGRVTPDGVVRVRPLIRVIQGGGPSFTDDSSYSGRDHSGYVHIAPVGPVTPVALDSADLTTYLKDLQRETGFIKISGIGSDAGNAKTALPQYPIEQLYTPLRSRVSMSEHPRSQDAETAITSGEATLAFRTVFPQHRKLFIEGQPGAGKTTFLKLVASCLARDGLGLECHEGVPWRKHHLGLDGGAPPVPIFLRVADLVALLIANSRPGCRDDRFWFIELLETRNKNSTGFPNRDYWIDQLEHGKALLLVDGLDESGDERIRERVLEILQDACAHWGESQIVVSSRPIQARFLEDMGFHHTIIEPFGTNDITSFVDRWIEALYHLTPGEPLEAEEDEYKEGLLSAILGMPQIKRIATNPVMLTCLCVVHWNEGRLPEGRSRVYRAVIKWLIAARSAKREEAGFSDIFARNGFARLALHMMDGEGGKQVVIDLEPAAELLEPLVQREFSDLKTSEEYRKKGKEWLRFECLGSGIVEEMNNSRVRFWHLTFQEYLAGRQLAFLSDYDQKDKPDAKPEDSWWPIVKPHLSNPQWRETIELLPGCLLDDGGGRRVDLLLDRVLGERGAKPSLAREARIVGIMGHLFHSLEVFKYKADATLREEYRKARQRALEIFTEEGSQKVPVNQRIETAEALGRGGDPRLTPETIECLPIPGMRGLKLGKYPVTVEEYQRFVDGRGYDDTYGKARTYWDEAGWKFKTKNEWEAPEHWERQLETPNRPVVEVSWYEATAYCRWLSDVRDRSYRLPTAAEWEATARPKKGEYPWGTKKPNPELANYGESGINDPTPVGLYPRGAGPAGHLDLAGNVWEWCEDEREWGDMYRGKEDPAETARALRGGGCWGGAEFLLVSLRRGGPARYRGHSLGFRVLLCPASTVT